MLSTVKMEMVLGMHERRLLGAWSQIQVASVDALTLTVS